MSSQVPHQRRAKLPSWAIVRPIGTVVLTSVIVVLGLVFLAYAWKLMDPPDEFFAMRVFNYSIVYLMALFAFLLVDHWLLPWLQPMTAMAAFNPMLDPVA